MNSTESSRRGFSLDARFFILILAGVTVLAGLAYIVAFFALPWLSAVSPDSPEEEITPYEIIVAENNGDPFTLDLSSDGVAGTPRTLDYILLIIPLAGLGLIIWGAVIASGLIPFDKVMSGLGGLYVIQILVPFAWQWISERDWRSVLGDLGYSDERIDAALTDLSEIYSFYVFLYILFIPFLVTIAVFGYLRLRGQIDKKGKPTVAPSPTAPSIH